MAISKLSAVEENFARNFSEDSASTAYENMLRETFERKMYYMREEMSPAVRTLSPSHSTFSYTLSLFSHSLAVITPLSRSTTIIYQNIRTLSTNS